MIVSNSIDFVNSLQDETEIRLTSGEFSLDGIEIEYNRHAYMRNTYDGSELVIRKKRNAVICGDPDNNSSLIISAVYSTVLNLEYCEGIEIDNLTLGHTPKRGSCDGDVLGISDSEGIRLKNLDLFGCGRAGLCINDSHNIIVENCVIRECSESIMELYHCENITFTNCIFRNNCSKTIAISHCNEIRFENCLFQDNDTDWFYTDKDGNSYIFVIGNSSGDIELNKCSFDDRNICSKMDRIHLADAIFVKK